MPASPTTLDRLSSALEGRYSIIREIGAGGMATVYLAEDVRHRRKVAIKVLHPELTAVLGPERFLNEIELTANLQHPHILPLFDSGAADNLLFYVMPFVEGETLRQKLMREQQLPIAEAVRIASDIADALEYAHKHGVVHRDIKPENVLLHEGRPLVADFGIALAVQHAGGARMTQTGMSLGTPQYMAPEQAMGDKAVDHRADIYALGAVTYEMLTGEPPFTGPNSQAVVAKILTTDPSSLVSKRRSVPPHVNAAVLTALEKMPADRFASAAQFAEALAGRGSVLGDSRATPTASAQLRHSNWRTAFAAAAAAAVVVTAVAAWSLTRSSGADGIRAAWEYIELSDSVGVNLNFPALALSPDGNSVVFRENITETRLWIKNRDDLEPRQMPGTERAQNPAFSPDGEWLAFIADGRLKKVGVRGGAAVTLADSALSGFGGAAWLDDGSIIYVAPSQFELRKVSAAGGSYTVAFRDTALGGRGIGNPSALPDSRGVLYELCSSGCVTSSLYAVDFRSGTAKVVLEDAVQGWYLPTGHILHVRRDGAALVAPFDLDKLEISGGAVPVLENVAGGAGFAQLAWSPSGALVYVSGGARARDNAVARVSRSGVITPIDTSWAGQFNSIALASDSRRLALGVGLGTSALNIWIKQLDRGPFTRLTFGGRDRRPEWSPDGKMVAFIRDTLTTGVAIVRPADGTGSERPLLRLPQQLQEIAWSPDGEWIVVRTDNAGPGAGDLIGVRTRGDTTPVPLVTSAFTELNPTVSPDGRWLAYASNESGRSEVYVRPFPGTSAGLFQVSLDGGGQPRWSRRGSELFFIGARGQLVAATVRTSPSFEVVQLQALFSTSPFILDAFHQAYDVASDGSFLFVGARQFPGARAPRVVRVDNWFSDVRARMPK
ncbi:MAG TPA: protein kinase [Gemmatimonadaceae bacterium]|nr:protein kinase [Gemmatimonadaceae bacterium]